MKTAFMVSVALVVFVALITTAYFVHEGYEISLRHPFLWRDSDQHPRAHETCSTLMELGSAITSGIENSLDLGPLDSIEKIAQTLEKHDLVRDLSCRVGSERLERDNWGNKLKVKTRNQDGSKTILIYSDTPNELPMRPEGYNLFVELIIDSNRKVSMTGTWVPENGRIVLKKYVSGK